MLGKTRTRVRLLQSSSYGIRRCAEYADFDAGCLQPLGRLCIHEQQHQEADNGYKTEYGDDPRNEAVCDAVGKSCDREDGQGDGGEPKELEQSPSDSAAQVPAHHSVRSEKTNAEQEDAKNKPLRRSNPGK
jgi:hypothetical protein